MKEFFKITKLVLIFQIINWIIIMLISELISPGLAIIVEIIICIVLLCMYFIYEKKYIEKLNNNYPKNKFFLFINWVFFSVVICFIFLKLVELDFLAPCDKFDKTCFFSGIGYAGSGVALIYLVYSIIILKILYWMFNKILKMINKKDKTI